jgi:beta-phosphoglucomutase
MSKTLGVIFDMDGVIVDSNPYHKLALNKFCAQHGKHLSDDDLFKKVYGRTNKEWLINLFGNIPENQLRAYAEEKEAIFRDLYKNDIKPVKGLIGFLNLLNERKIARSIGTSAPRANVDFTLSKTGLEKYFEIILDDTFVNVGKPNPEIYIKSCQALGLPPGQCIVIEDSLSGIKAGKASGAKVVGITTTHTAEEMRETDLVIDDFDSLTVEMLEKLIP